MLICGVRCCTAEVGILIFICCFRQRWNVTDTPWVPCRGRSLKGLGRSPRGCTPGTQHAKRLTAYESRASHTWTFACLDTHFNTLRILKTGLQGGARIVLAYVLVAFWNCAALLNRCANTFVSNHSSALKGVLRDSALKQWYDKRFYFPEHHLSSKRMVWPWISQGKVCSVLTSVSRSAG